MATWEKNTCQSDVKSEMQGWGGVGGKMEVCA